MPYFEKLKYSWLEIAPRFLLMVWPLLIIPGLDAQTDIKEAPLPDYLQEVLIPKKQALKAPLKKVPFKSNLRKAEPPKKIAIPDKLPYYIPGEGEFLPLMKKPVGTLDTQKIVLEPVENGFNTRYQDRRTRNIQIFELDPNTSSNFINSLMEDSRGYIWIGSAQKLFRLEGNSLVQISGEKGIFGDYIGACLEDNAGKIWIKTSGNGVYLLDGNNLIHFTEESGLCDNRVRTVYQDSRGNIWIGTMGGLNIWDGKNLTRITEKEGLAKIDVMSICEDKDGNIWIGTVRGGLLKYDGTGFVDYNQISLLTGKIIYDIFQDQSGQLWFGTNGALVSFDGTHFLQYHSNTKSTFLYSHILQDSEKGIWYNRKQKGSRISKNDIIRLHKGWEEYYILEDGLGDGRIQSHFLDKYENIWFGTTKGISKFFRYPWHHITRYQGIEHEQTVDRIIQNRDGNLVFTTWGGGIVFFDKHSFYSLNTEQGKWFSPISNIVLQDSKGNYWFDNGMRGIQYFDGQSLFTFENSDSVAFVKPLLVLRNETIWIQTTRGLLLMDSNSKIFKWYPVSTKEIGYIETAIEDQNGKIWLGTDLGVLFQNDTGFSWFKGNSQLPSSIIQSLYSDKSGNIWIGTKEGLGIFIQDTLHIFNKKPLTGKSVYSIVQDFRGNMWVGCNAEIFYLSKKRGNGPKNGKTFFKSDTWNIATFSRQDGLVGNYYLGMFCEKDSTLWVGHEDGLTYLDLKTFELPVAPPQLQLNRIEINDQVVDYRNLSDTTCLFEPDICQKLIGGFGPIEPFKNYPSMLSLPYKLNHLTFWFSGMDFSGFHEIKFSFRILEMDSTWSRESTENKADFRNLPPGKFTFEVKAKGKAGNWSEPLVYQFVIHPPCVLTPNKLESLITLEL